MCFSPHVSLGTFIIGFTFSLLLFKYGNKQYKAENEISGIFFIFISLIQFMDFLFWIDLKNDYGINRIATIISPLLNVCQPTILYIVKMLYFQPTIRPYDVAIALLNATYFAYFIIKYIEFIQTDNLITTTKNGHLSWSWIKYYNPVFYLILFAINIFYLVDFNYALLLFSITYFFLFLSYWYFNRHVGELWCFFGAFIPLILFILTFFLVKNH